MGTLDVAVLVGSLRKGSFNRKMALALAELAKPKLALEIVEIGDLSLYDEDVDASPPAEWTRFRERIRSADAVLFVTPEYNRSVPGALKNASTNDFMNVRVSSFTSAPRSSKSVAAWPT